MSKFLQWFIDNSKVLISLITVIISILPTILDYFKDSDKEKTSKKVESFSSTDKTFKNDYFDGTDVKPLQIKINNLDDLIKLGESYDENSPVKYVINLKLLNRCVPELKELNSMIGMKSIKQNILDIFYFYFQDFTKNDQNKHMMHSIIEGDPGCGKTEVAKILSKLYYKMGVVKQNKFTQITREDCMGRYLGQTEEKTKALFSKAKGGVIFIDEAYSMGYEKNVGQGGGSSYSQIFIDMLTSMLTEEKGNTVVILAGYAEDIKEKLFSHNKGLFRRFPYRFTIKKYTAKQLELIYKKKVKDDDWQFLDNKLDPTFFKKRKKYFKYSGGDMETLWAFTKKAHAKRVFGCLPCYRKKITQEDLTNAFKMFVSNAEVKERIKKTKEETKIDKEKINKLFKNLLGNN